MGYNPYVEDPKEHKSDLAERIKKYALASGNLKLIKVLGFTITESDGEIGFLEEWLNARLAGNDEKADDLVFTGGMVEHFQSVVSENPDEVTDEEQKILADLVAFREEARSEEDKRPNPVIRERDGREGA